MGVGSLAATGAPAGVRAAGMRGGPMRLGKAAASTHLTILVQAGAGVPLDGLANVGRSSQVLEALELQLILRAWHGAT